MVKREDAAKAEGQKNVSITIVASLWQRPLPGIEARCGRRASQAEVAAGSGEAVSGLP